MGVTPMTPIYEPTNTPPHNIGTFFPSNFFLHDPNDMGKVRNIVVCIVYYNKTFSNPCGHLQITRKPLIYFYTTGHTFRVQIKPLHTFPKKYCNLVNNHFTSAMYASSNYKMQIFSFTMPYINV